MKILSRHKLIDLVLESTTDSNFLFLQENAYVVKDKNIEDAIYSQVKEYLTTILMRLRIDNVDKFNMVFGPKPFSEGKYSGGFQDIEILDTNGQRLGTIDVKMSMSVYGSELSFVLDLDNDNGVKLITISSYYDSTKGSRNMLDYIATDIQNQLKERHKVEVNSQRMSQKQLNLIAHLAGLPYKPIEKEHDPSLDYLPRELFD